MSGNATVVIVSTTTTTDAYGDTVVTTAETPWVGASFAPRYARESSDSMAPNVVVGLTIYGPAVTLDADDQVKVDGVLYDLDGLPGYWKSHFTGWEPGVEVAVKRATEVV